MDPRRHHHHDPPVHHPHPVPPPPIVHHHPGPPPPPVVHHHPGPPPPPMVHHHPGPPPPPVVHHHPGPPPPPVVHHHPDMPPPPVVHHHSGPHPPPLVVDVHDPRHHKQTYRVYCRANPDLLLTVRGGKVILAPAKPSDDHQRWYKEEKHSTRVKDEEGLPSFILVNKATNHAIKHSLGATHPVRLVPYNPDILDESIMWSESKNTGEDYKTIRMVNNIRLNMDAFHGDKQHGGVRDGTPIVLWEWTKGDNQRWKILPN
ncbi:unnamed protein product [Cuscuta epithymum]|uniref:Hydroxyproline-rich glycoprotein family protein n=1 Tax=Cuscuta epithymum TaxID=186058 RepID=A0AAV0EPJ7_9ASTE|nr:unnamed protein product [Cuscuta epithymum]